MLYETKLIVRMREGQKDRMVYGVIHQDGVHDVDGMEERQQVPFWTKLVQISRRHPEIPSWEMVLDLLWEVLRLLLLQPWDQIWSLTERRRRRDQDSILQTLPFKGQLAEEEPEREIKKIIVFLKQISDRRILQYCENWASIHKKGLRSEALFTALSRALPILMLLANI